MKLDDLQKCCVLSNKNGQWYAEGHAIEEEGVVENGYFVSLSQATEYVSQKAEIERLKSLEGQLHSTKFQLSVAIEALEKLTHESIAVIALDRIDNIV